MKNRYSGSHSWQVIILALLLTASLASAQIRSIYDVMYNPANPGGPSPFAGQRIQVTGIVTNTAINANVVGGDFSFSIQSRGDTTAFHGLFVISSSLNPQHLVTVGDSVIITGRVSTTAPTNIKVSSTDQIQIVSATGWIPTNPVFDMTVLTNEDSAKTYSGMYVKVANPIIQTIATDGATLTNRSVSLLVGGGGSSGRWTYQLTVGDSLNWIGGTLRKSTAGWMLEPRGDADFLPYGNLPPVLSQIDATPNLPTPDDHVVFNVKVTSAQSQINQVWLTYFINDIRQDSILMHKANGANDSIYTATAGPWWRGASLRFRAKAKDNNNLISSSFEKSFTVNFPGGLLPFKYIADNIDTFLNTTQTLDGMVVYYQLRSGRTDAYFVDTTFTYTFGSDTIRSVGLYISESGAPSTFPNLKRGNYIRMPSAISYYAYSNPTSYSLQVTGLTNATVLASDLPLPRPTRCRTGDAPLLNKLISCSKAPYYNSGSWLEVTGRIITVNPTSGGVNLLVDDGSGTLPIRIVDGSNLRYVRAYNPDTSVHDSIPLSQMVNRLYRIRGVASKYYTDFQMAVGFADDIVEYDPKVGDTDEPIIDVPARVLVNDLNEQMTIRYGGKSGSRIQLRVFNLKGQVVATLADRTSNGIAEITWDGRNDLREKLPLGTYIIQVVTNTNGSTKSALAPIVIGTKLK